MDPIAHAAQAFIHEQTAQPREPRHYDRRRARPGPAHLHASALLGQRPIRFRVRLSHPDVSFPQPDRGDVPRPDEQRRRHHSRPRCAPARTKPERPVALLRFLEVRLAGFFRALSMHPFCPDRELHPRDPGDVLDRSRHHADDGDGRRGPGPGHLVARGRSEDGGQYRPARPDSADHHGWSAHQIRGHESQPRAGLHFQPLVLRASE